MVGKLICFSVALLLAVHGASASLIDSFNLRHKHSALADPSLSAAPSLGPVGFLTQSSYKGSSCPGQISSATIVSTGVCMFDSQGSQAITITSSSNTQIDYTVISYSDVWCKVPNTTVVEIGPLTCKSNSAGSYRVVFTTYVPSTNFGNGVFEG